MSEARSFINLETKNYESLKSELMLSRNQLAKFDVLNAHLAGGVVIKGELVILGDPSTPNCTSHEAFLMAEAANIHADLARNGPDDFLIQNFDFIKGLLAHASMGVGMASDAWSRHLESIKKTLQEIEKLYQDFLRDGRGNRRDRFYVKRADLFARLRQQLRFFASFGSGLRGDGSIKSRLGISTKSFLHTGEIPGYAEKVAGVVRASKLLKKGTYLAMTIEVGSTAASIYKACTLGREEECRKAKYVEGGALVGGMSGGVIGGALGSLSGGIVCGALGVSSVGTGALVCSVLGGATGGALLGSGGSEAGGKIGLHLYEEGAW
ncbi:hypothetical protein [Pseudomonas guariconensis]|uniref:hypothetical protein n=1 Tax=Pseudomonas guariconensis TaxID=1288410 RepID=UPI002D1E8F5F|nr:hypothetical protein [Pseudomonas guariconensis]MEB3840999.1 hypothetical protein [Pseudomonas guariconensis]MEB3873867.1 hypothetical protein [Pseudomonas guariconensis]MEB3879526.1 hypothetical protein [Pseudomonas guariconensis]MEB3895292.1 hypothetical protein [Pseudomonas guariconensis]